jgi:multidrug efflux pump subunit AcrA (membrane-fusion protein)
MRIFKVVPIIPLVLMLGACSVISNGTKPLPTVMLGSGTESATPQAADGNGVNPSGVTASGIVVPAINARLAFSQAGTVKTAAVAAGDQVESGQALIELDDTAIQLEIAQAERTLRELTSQAAIAAAEQAVAASQKAAEDAQKKLNTLNYGRADDKAIDYYESQLTLAERALDHAKSVVESLTELTTADPKRATAETNLHNAQKAYNAALANLNWARGKPSDNDFATAQANLDAANAAYQEAQWYLATLKDEPVPESATGQQLALLQQAKDSLKAAQDRLSKSRILAPFSGTIVATHVVPGEYVLPGQVLVELSDINHLEVETTDLSERDVPSVEVGQPVSIYVKALNQEMTGKVTMISPLADTLGGDVVYKTTIVLDDPPPGLRAGMSAEVQFIAK